MNRSALAAAIKAQISSAWAIQAKETAIRRCDERVTAAEARSAAEIAELAQVCGSAEAAAEILGWSIRQVCRTIKSERERRADSVGSGVVRN